MSQADTPSVIRPCPEQLQDQDEKGSLPEQPGGPGEGSKVDAVEFAVYLRLGLARLFSATRQEAGRASTAGRERGSALRAGGRQDTGQGRISRPPQPRSASRSCL
jgi:hypothetical protein